MAQQNPTCVEVAIRSVNNAIEQLKPHLGSRKSSAVQQSKQTPRTPEARLQPASSSSAEQNATHLSIVDTHVRKPATFLYLAYGSNLSAETFRGKRNINPLSQVNVVVPDLSLTFDLPGIPYTEPCFGNCRYRREDEKEPTSTEDYHKDRWKKGMVGVVYEVTAEDFAHIIATEGGGAGYTDVLIDCFALDEDPSKEVPLNPTNPAFKAHTLFGPPSRSFRPDKSYAQPSARYKKLITDGAQEHELPYEYRDFLDGLRTYQITTTSQRMGQWVFSMTWLPLLSFIFLGGGRIFLRKDGTYPPWFANLLSATFLAVWGSYDDFFKPIFGDGERTIKGGSGDSDNGHVPVDEKAPLLRNMSHNKLRKVDSAV